VRIGSRPSQVRTSRTSSRVGRPGPHSSGRVYALGASDRRVAVREPNTLRRRVFSLEFCYAVRVSLRWLLSLQRIRHHPLLGGGPRDGSPAPSLVLLSEDFPAPPKSLACALLGSSAAPCAAKTTGPLRFLVGSSVRSSDQRRLPVLAPRPKASRRSRRKRTHEFRPGA
jgi:hypothetical protein